MKKIALQLNKKGYWLQRLWIALLLLMSLNTEAVTTKEINGVWYNLDVKTGLAEVTSRDNKYQGDIVIPDSVVYARKTYHVTAIGSYAFFASTITSLSLPNSLRVISEKAFMNSTTPVEVVLPNGLKEIGDQAFRGCSRLKILHIPDSLEDIGGSAFADINLDTVYVNTIEHWCSISRGIQPHRYLSHLVASGEEIKDLTIPSTITVIKPWTFFGCSGLQTVTIAESVTDIGESAFKHCSSITSFNIPNSVLRIEEGAFHGCSSLEDISLPDGLTTIGNYFFGNCKSLKEMKLPDHVSSIGDYAFQNCNGLMSVTLPEGLSSIGRSAFYRCTSLASIELPEGLRSIGVSAFEGCKVLTSIKLPASISSVDYWAFANLESLKTFYCSATQAPRIHTDAFYDTNIHLAMLHVPASAIEDYDTTEPWCYFGEIKAITNGIDNMLVNDANHEIYFDLQGKHLQQLKKGVNIIKSVDGTTRTVIVH